MRVRAALVALALVGSCGGGCGGGQHEVTVAGELLTVDGRLREPGWSRRALQRFDAARVREAERLRRWDFYTLVADEIAVNLTLGDLGFVQVATVSVIEMATSAKHETTQLLLGPDDVFELSQDVDGNARLVPAGASAPALAFSTVGAGETRVEIDMPGRNSASRRAAS